MGAIVDFIFGILLFMLKWLLILSWRFFTGAHMTGNHFNDSTFWHDATNAKKRAISRPRQYSWWRRKARYKRMIWRHAVFWPALILSIGFAWDWSTMLIILGFMGFPVWFMTEPYHHGWHRIRLLFQNPAVGHDSDGTVYQVWTWKSPIRHARRKLKTPPGERWHPGIATRAELAGEPRVTELTPDMERAVRAELAEELPPGGPIELKLLLDPGVDYGD
jgi:hypothetical protein